jgi:RNA polymerase sigma-70 factor (ECF subfamily)
MLSPIRSSVLSKVQSQFVETDWGVVLRSQGSTESGEALAKLCEQYWYPLYCFARRQGQNPHDAEDLVQGFFGKVVEKNYFKDAKQEKGRLRTFLLVALKRYMANEWDREHRQKRGGGREFVSLNLDETETRFRCEPATQDCLDKNYNREWATTLLGRVLTQLEAECAVAGTARLFEEVKIFLTGEKSEQTYADIAKRMGVAEGTLRGTVFRLRQRYREILMRTIAETVDRPAEVESELRDLFAAVS